MLNIAAILAGLTRALLDSLRADGGLLKELAVAEAENLAKALATIARLLAAGEIDREEAEVLISIQRNASEAVLASLTGVSAVAARRATKAAFGSIVGLVDGVLGFPLVASLT